MGGILHLVEDRPTPKNVYNWRVYVLALIASCGSNMIGYTSGFIGTTITLPSFEAEFGLDKMSDSAVDLISENIVSLFIAGAFFGALLTYGISHFFGRKWSLTISSAVFILGSGLQMGANGSRGLGILYAGRVLSGLGTGVASNVVPIYLSELAPPAIRGRLVGFYELGWQVGGMVGFWINVSGFTSFLYPTFKIPPSLPIVALFILSRAKADDLFYSMVLNKLCPQTTSNGLFPLLFN